MCEREKDTTCRKGNSRTAGCQPAFVITHTSMTEEKDDLSRPKGWHDRGYLPHFDGGEIIQFITFRLADSLPQNVVEGLKLKLERNLISEIEYHRKIDKYLDNGFGCGYLKDCRIAEVVEENLHRFDGVRYKLFSWVIMPNHVHILLRPMENTLLSDIMHSMKSYTANRANKVLNRTGKFWSAEYFDRYMRDYDHFEKTVAYIHGNPVKAGLCEKASDWRFSSAWIDMAGTQAASLP